MDKYAKLENTTKGVEEKLNELIQAQQSKDGICNNPEHIELKKMFEEELKYKENIHIDEVNLLNG